MPPLAVGGVARVRPAILHFGAIEARLERAGRMLAGANFFARRARDGHGGRARNPGVDGSGPLAHGVSALVDYRLTFTPTVNSEREADLACDAAAELVGEEHVDRDHHLLSGSEDFSFMLESRPGAFILIGNGEDAAPVHSSRYEFDDRILPLGSALCARVAERELGRGGVD